MGPEQLMVVHGDHHLRRNELADATAAYISGTRNGGDSAAINTTRLGLVMVARIDEQVSFAARATDIGSEEEALKGAAMAQRRARDAFNHSLARDKMSSASAIAYVGSAECMIEEAMLLKKEAAANPKPRRDSEAKVAKAAKLRRGAMRRYAAAFTRDLDVRSAASRPLCHWARGARLLPAGSLSWCTRAPLLTPFTAAALLRAVANDARPLSLSPHP